MFKGPGVINTLLSVHAHYIECMQALLFNKRSISDYLVYILS